MLSRARQFNAHNTVLVVDVHALRVRVLSSAHHESDYYDAKVQVANIGVHGTGKSQMTRSKDNEGVACQKEPRTCGRRTLRLE